MPPPAALVPPVLVPPPLVPAPVPEPAVGAPALLSGVPLAGVNIVFTPVESVITVVVPATAPRRVTPAVDAFVVLLVVDCCVTAPDGATIRGTGPSGMMQFTSRSEQNSGMVVRSVESAPSEAPLQEAASVAAMKLIAIE